MNACPSNRLVNILSKKFGRSVNGQLSHQKRNRKNCQNSNSKLVGNALERECESGGFVTEAGLHKITDESSFVLSTIFCAEDLVKKTILKTAEQDRNVALFLSPSQDSPIRSKITLPST